MGRFLALSLPLLVVLIGLYSIGLRELGLMPPMDDLAVLGLERGELLPLRLVASGWLIEALGLAALFLLIQGRGGAWWLDGVVAALIGWVFRGPIQVLSIVSLSRLGSDPWWPMALRWLALYLTCGLVLAWVARKVGLRR